MILTPFEICQHLRVPVESLGADGALLLQVYEDAAWGHVEAFTNRTWPRDASPPAAINAAVLLLIGDLWEHRTAQGEARLYENKAVERLLWPHRVWTAEEAA